MNVKRGQRVVVSFFVVLATLFYHVIPLGWLNSTFVPKAEAGWYNSDVSWRYKQKLTVNNSGSQISDYQLLLSEEMVARWKMDENSGTSVSDISGYSQGGTITGTGISWTSSGKYSNALSFSGDSSSYISMGNPTKLTIPDKNLTISTWAKSSSSDHMRIISKGHYSYSTGYTLEFNSGHIYAGIGSGTQSTSLYFYTDNTFNDDSWHHIAAVFDTSNSKAYIYVDGTAQNLTITSGTCGTASGSELSYSSCSSNISTSNSNNFYIGRYDGSAVFPWNGTLDEIRVYSKALSSGDVDYLYDNNSSPLLRSHIYSNSQDDGDDLRFTTSDGTTNIPYYSELYTGVGQNTRIWLKVPSLSASTTTDIYVYYGNSSASAVSSLADTYAYTDNFSDDSLSSNWTISSSGNGTISESGGKLVFSYSGTSTDWWTAPTNRQQKIITYNTMPSYDFWVQIKLESYTVRDRTHAGIAVYGSDTSAYIFGRKDGATNDDYRLDKLGTSDIAYHSSTTLPSYLAIIKISSGYSFRISFDNITWYPVGSSYSDVTFNNIALFGKSWNSNALDFSIDDFMIRKYLASPPTVTPAGSYIECDIDPIFTFSVEGVNSAVTNNGITTSITSSYNLIPFGKLEAETPKYAAQKLTVKSNSTRGYTVTVKLDGYIQGLYPANKIDPFAGTDASWSTPQEWSSPDGIEPNTDTGWFGANTSDIRVNGWSNSSGKFGPISSTAHTVMTSSTQESSGVSKYVSYAIEISAIHPADSYAGTIIYSAVPTY